MTYKPCSKIINATFKKKKYITQSTNTSVYKEEEYLLEEKKNIYFAYPPTDI